MPAKSKAQQRFFGLVRSVQKGDTPKKSVSKAVRRAARDMSVKDVRKFASTKTKGLPRKVGESILRSIIKEEVENAVNNGQATDMQELMKLKKRLEDINKPYEVYPDGHYEKDEVFRPNYCYADGIIEDDLGGTDYFYLSPNAAYGDLKNMTDGMYRCTFNGKPCTLYVIGRNGRLCYDDDYTARASILQQLLHRRN